MMGLKALVLVVAVIGLLSIPVQLYNLKKEVGNGNEPE